MHRDPATYRQYEPSYMRGGAYVPPFVGAFLLKKLLTNAWRGDVVEALGEFKKTYARSLDTTQFEGLSDDEYLDAVKYWLGNATHDPDYFFDRNARVEYTPPVEDKTVEAHCG